MSEERVEPAAETSEKPEASGSDLTAQNIILKNVMWSAGVGLIPLPLVDLAGITALNLKMIRDLAIHYDVPFREELAKSAVASLLTAVSTPALVMGPVFSLLKVVPGAGQLLSGLAMPGVAGALTYATGRVFQRHFESGGTFLDFDASRFTSMFKREFEDGKEKAKEAAEAAEDTEAAKAAVG